MVLVHRRFSSKTWRRFNVSIWSENRRRKHGVVTTLDFVRSNNVGKTTLWQRCFDFVRRDDQKTTKNQRCHNVVCQLSEHYKLQAHCILLNFFSLVTSMCWCCLRYCVPFTVIYSFLIILLLKFLLTMWNFH